MDRTDRTPHQRTQRSQSSTPSVPSSPTPRGPGYQRGLQHSDIIALLTSRTRCSHVRTPLTHAHAPLPCLRLRAPESGGRLRLPVAEAWRRVRTGVHKEENSVGILLLDRKSSILRPTQNPFCHAYTASQRPQSAFLHFSGDWRPAHSSLFAEQSLAHLSGGSDRARRRFGAGCSVNRRTSAPFIFFLFSVPCSHSHADPLRTACP